VSNFYLDKYEVTVGRFRNFVASYNAWRAAGNPQAAAGEHVPGYGSGWKTTWNAKLPATATALVASVKCGDPSLPAAYETWRDTAGGPAAENLPMTCLSWFDAFLFCIWDGGRLATEAEWEYAAGHGSENRTYPWGPTAPSDTLAVFNCCGNGTCGTCSYTDILPVGSKPAGNGFWGHADLAGSMWEWVFDWYASPYPSPACDNCANITTASNRVIRGGNYNDSDTTALTAANRHTYNPSSHDYGHIGTRCAMTIP